MNLGQLKHNIDLAFAAKLNESIYNRLVIEVSELF